MWVVVSGSVANAIGMPLGYMLGPAFIGLALACVGKPLGSDRWVGDVGRGVLGACIGGAVTTSFFIAVFSEPVLLVVLVAYVWLAGLLGFAWLHHARRWPASTAYFASLPGGLSEMVELARETNSHPPQVALAHTLRVFFLITGTSWVIWWLGGVGLESNTFGAIERFDLVVLTLSVAVGIPLGQRLRIPAPSVMGPLILAGLLSVGLDWRAGAPELVIILAQLGIGWSLGHRFAGSTLAQVKRQTPEVLALLLLLVPVWMGAAWLLDTLTAFEIKDTVLALAPGGQAEMLLLALLVQAAGPLVICLHLLRVILVLTSARSCHKLVVRYLSRASKGSS